MTNDFKFHEGLLLASIIGGVVYYGIFLLWRWI